MLRKWIDPRDGRSWTVTIGRVEGGDGDGASRTIIRFACERDQVETSTRERVVAASVLSDRDLMELLDSGRPDGGRREH